MYITPCCPWTQRGFLVEQIMKILIDGENIRHRLQEVLVQEGCIPPKRDNDYFAFDLGYLLQIALKIDVVRATYYTTRIRAPRFKIPQTLQKRIQEVQEANRRWV